MILSSHIQYPEGATKVIQYGVTMFHHAITSRTTSPDQLVRADAHECHLAVLKEARTLLGMATNGLEEKGETQSRENKA